MSTTALAIQVLRKAVRRTEATLHRPRGAVTQLLGVVARPSAGSLGGVLRSFVLRQAQLAGAQSVCGVTRCREWTAGGGWSYTEHVEKGSDRGLRFHLNTGAQMRGLVAGYRPDDASNEGHGVLIEYCVGGAADEEEAAVVREAASYGPLSLDGVKLVVAEVVDGLSYGASNAHAAMQTGFMELGLDSVDVVQLIDRLNDRLPSCWLAPTAVFAHPTPAALSAHIFEQQIQRRPKPLPARLVEPSPPATQFGGGTADSCLGGDGGVDDFRGVDSGSGIGSGVGGGGVGGSSSGGGVGGADSGLGVAGSVVGGSGKTEEGGKGQERTRNQDGKRRQNPEGKPPSPSKVHAEKRWSQNAKVAAALEPKADLNGLDDIVAVMASAARSGTEAPMQALTSGSVHP